MNRLVVNSQLVVRFLNHRCFFVFLPLNAALLALHDIGCIELDLRELQRLSSTAYGFTTSRDIWQ